MKITTYEYVQKPLTETELFIPEKPFYCFQTFIRRSIRIIPTIWNKKSVQSLKNGEVHKLDVTCVYQDFECKIERFTINMHMVQGYINNNEKNIKADICRMLLEEDYYIRTKEDFNQDLNDALKEINK